MVVIFIVCIFFGLNYLVWIDIFFGLCCVIFVVEFKFFYIVGFYLVGKINIFEGVLGLFMWLMYDRVLLKFGILVNFFFLVGMLFIIMYDV